MNKTILASVALALLGFGTPVKADVIGVMSTLKDVHFYDEIINAGHEYVNLTKNSAYHELEGLDQVWMIRTTANNNVTQYVRNGGTLITEWNSSQWALNTANLLNAHDAGQAFSQTTPVSFTDVGQSLGLGYSLGTSYSSGGATQYFRNFTAIGEGTHVVATANGYNVGVAGQYGAGNVVALGWDWQDDGVTGVDTLLVDDLVNLNFSSDYGTSAYARMSDVSASAPIAFTLLSFLGFLLTQRRKLVKSNLLD